MNCKLGQILHWHIYPTAEVLLDSAARAITRAASQSIARTGAFRVVLAGGKTPRDAYGKLRELGSDWHAWHIYFGDERCLPPDHPERNSRMAFDTWLDHVDIPRQQIHPIPAEQGPETGAIAYAETLRPVSEFDLVLLGLGVDGHTGSLFPGHPWGHEQNAPSVLPVLDAPKPQQQRVSMSARRLSAARQVLFMVSGADKREAVVRWRAGEMVPACAIAPRSGVDVLVEQSAFE